MEIKRRPSEENDPDDGGGAHGAGGASFTLGDTRRRDGANFKFGDTRRRSSVRDGGGAHGADDTSFRFGDTRRRSSVRERENRERGAGTWRSTHWGAVVSGCVEGLHAGGGGVPTRGMVVWFYEPVPAHTVWRSVQTDRCVCESESVRIGPRHVIPYPLTFG